MALPSAARLRRYRISLERTLIHRCTYTPVSESVEDARYHVTETPGTPVTSVPCRYETVQRAVRDAGGVTMISVSQLTVSASGPIVLGGMVSNVTDQLGGVLLAGPSRVDRVMDNTAGLGAPLLPTYALESADTERGD